MSQVPDTPSVEGKRGDGYYAERLLSQAVGDPRVDALEADEVRSYIKREAAKLCLDEQAVAEKAMRGYEMVTTGDFQKATAYSNAVVGSPHRW